MSSKSVSVGLSMMLSPEFQAATQPLFHSGLVDVLEWSFDMAWGRPLSPWAQQTLNEYSAKKKLLGHGVSYSALDASETRRQTAWLAQLAQEVSRLNYTHISEHFGFMGGGNFHIAAPLPVPRTPTAIAVGQQRMRQLADIAGVPVGLENLAFAFNANDLAEQGPFLNDLLEPIDGFLLLDLHNLYCQSYNFDVSISELLNTYPLHRVRELHVSGGSFSEHPRGSGQQVRRDTHDDNVPDDVFTALPEVLQRCPNVEAVILERMDGTINAVDVAAFQKDFRRLRNIVKKADL